MKQAMSYPEIWVECPYCQEHQAASDQPDDCSSELDTDMCEKCGKEFTYCHPESQYLDNP